MTGKQVYFGDWKDFPDMVKDFEGYNADLPAVLNAPRWQGLEVLFAAYTYESYAGDAFVLFKKEGQLYEVNGGHCSCYGLSESSYSGKAPDQWEPEPTTKQAVIHKLDEGSDYGIFGQFKEQIRAAVEAA